MLFIAISGDHGNVYDQTRLYDDTTLISLYKKKIISTICSTAC